MGGGNGNKTNKKTAGWIATGREISDQNHREKANESYGAYLYLNREMSHTWGHTTRERQREADRRNELYVRMVTN